ncbi:hypothetical protein AOLI_G00314470 [Acnodon oligacanthus]
MRLGGLSAGCRAELGCLSVCVAVVWQLTALVTAGRIAALSVEQDSSNVVLGFSSRPLPADEAHRAVDVLTRRRCVG